MLPAAELRGLRSPHIFMSLLKCDLISFPREGSGVEGKEKPAASNALSKAPAPKKKGINKPMPRPTSLQADLRVTLIGIRAQHCTRESKG
jgi:hypothetical protein